MLLLINVVEFHRRVINGSYEFIFVEMIPEMVMITIRTLSFCVTRTLFGVYEDVTK